MPIIETKVSSSSEVYITNYNHNKNLSNKLFEILEKIEKMGPSKYVEKHTQRGKFTARERINLLKDKDTNFLEFSPLAGFELYEDSVPAGGIITGIIYVHCRLYL
jgi:3-methylcrotonyl-CoA carboxylase beta subunit